MPAPRPHHQWLWGPNFMRPSACHSSGVFCFVKNVLPAVLPSTMPVCPKIVAPIRYLFFAIGMNPPTANCHSLPTPSPAILPPPFKVGSLIEFCGLKWTPVCATSVTNRILYSPLNGNQRGRLAVATEVRRRAGRREDAELGPDSGRSILVPPEHRTEVQPQVASRGARGVDRRRLAAPSERIVGEAGVIGVQPSWIHVTGSDAATMNRSRNSKPRFA